MWVFMEIQQIKCLLAVADTLHFGRAAQGLNMLPASLGRHIKMLEENLGVRLLLRTTRRVALTDAGQEFVVAAKDIVERIEQLETTFRARQKLQSEVLRIGVIDSAAAGLMPQLLPHLNARHPDIAVEMLEQKTIRLLPRVLTGRLDIAIVRPPDVWDSRLEYRPLFSETIVVAVPENHRLASKQSISVYDMIDEPLIVPDRASRPHSHDLTMKLFLEAGLTARVSQIAEEKQTIVSLVSTGVGLAIVPKWASRLGIEGVSFVNLAAPDAPRKDALELAAVWLCDTRHPARDSLLEVLETYSADLARSA